MAEVQSDMQRLLSHRSATYSNGDNLQPVVHEAVLNPDVIHMIVRFCIAHSVGFHNVEHPWTMRYRGWLGRRSRWTDALPDVTFTEVCAPFWMLTSACAQLNQQWRSHALRFAPLGASLPDMPSALQESPLLQQLETFAVRLVALRAFDPQTNEPIPGQPGQAAAVSFICESNVNEAAQISGGMLRLAHALAAWDYLALQAHNSARLSSHS